MVGHLQKAGMTLIPEAEKADVVIVNTCSFLQSAKEESIQSILEVNQERGLRKRRKEQKLIVAGCMAQRFAKELPQAMPEIDASSVSIRSPRSRRSSSACLPTNVGKKTRRRYSFPSGPLSSQITTRRASASRQSTPRISRSPRAATTPAPSAPSPRSAAATAAAPSRASSPRRASSSPTA